MTDTMLDPETVKFRNHLVLGSREMSKVVNTILANNLPLTEAGAVEAARISGKLRICPGNPPASAQRMQELQEFAANHRPEQNPWSMEIIRHAQAVIAAVRSVP